jgi:serine/threonine protein kinase
MTVKREEMVGSLIYHAPEVLSNYLYSPKSDIYSIGHIFMTMLKGAPLYSG